MFESYLSGPLSEVSAALAVNQPRDDAEAQQRIWVVRALTARHGGGTTYTVQRFTIEPGIVWSSDKVGAMTYPEAQRKAWSLTTTPIGAPTQKEWEKTGDIFSTVVNGQQLSWSLWKENIGVSKVMPRYMWSARDPNPGVMQTQDMKPTDRLVLPTGSSVENAKMKAAEWAKQFEIPTPEQQGANLAQALQQFKVTTGQEVFKPGGKPSKLPWILGSVAVVAAVGLLWWRFR